MSEYLLDTNHASPLVTVGHPLRERVLARHQAGDTFAICAPVLNEFLFGIATLPRAQANLREWEYLKIEFTFYGVDAADAEEAFKVRLNLRRQGRQLDLVDSFVAVVALRYNLTLLTKDKDFLAVPNLQQANWLV
ncbi:MAG: type II toxin-antitoxin system VapC family toxin [Chloroflexota bacterium]|nr:type II toxin-antitoxin system VapC family toxin [Chloroflexota bacterium]